jgi:hypothetical protein
MMTSIQQAAYGAVVLSKAYIKFQPLGADHLHVLISRLS